MNIPLLVAGLEFLKILKIVPLLSFYSMDLDPALKKSF